MAEIGESTSSNDISSQGTVDSDDSTFEETEAYSGRQQEYLGARPYSFEPRIEKKEDCEAGDEDGAHVDPRDCGDISRLQNVEWYRECFFYLWSRFIYFPNIIIESVVGWCKLQLAMRFSGLFPWPVPHGSWSNRFDAKFSAKDPSKKNIQKETGSVRDLTRHF